MIFEVAAFDVQFFEFLKFWRFDGKPRNIKSYWCSIFDDLRFLKFSGFWCAATSKIRTSKAAKYSDFDDLRYLMFTSFHVLRLWCSVLPFLMFCWFWLQRLLMKKLQHQKLQNIKAVKHWIPQIIKKWAFDVQMLQLFHQQPPYIKTLKTSKTTKHQSRKYFETEHQKP